MYSTAKRVGDQVCDAQCTFLCMTHVNDQTTHNPPKRHNVLFQDQPPQCRKLAPFYEIPQKYDTSFSIIRFSIFFIGRKMLSLLIHVVTKHVDAKDFRQRRLEKTPENLWKTPTLVKAAKDR